MQSKNTEQRAGRDGVLDDILEPLITHTPLPEVFSATGIKPVSFTQQTKAAQHTLRDGFVCSSIYCGLTGSKCKLLDHEVLPLVVAPDLNFAWHITGAQSVYFIPLFSQT